MADTLNFSDISASLREAFSDGSTDDLFAKEHPLLGMIKRERNFADATYRVAVKYLQSGGAHPVLADAITNSVAAQGATFDVTTVDEYQVAQISGRLVEQAAMGNASRYLKEMVDNIDDAMTQLTNRIAHQMYRSSGGSLGTVGAGTASPITMLYPEQTDGIEIGTVLAFNDGDNSTTMRSGTGVVTAIDRDAGTITYTGTVTALAVGDHVFVSGFQGASPSGLDAWCPSSAPSSSTFFGVNRTLSPKLGGTRVDASQMGPEETFARVFARSARNAVKPDVFFLHPSDFATLEISAASSKVTMDSSEYKFGYEALVGPGGIKIIPDSDCQRGVMWGVPTKHVGVVSIGDAPKILNADGNDILRAATTDTYQARVGARLNMFSDYPEGIVRVALAV